MSHNIVELTPSIVGAGSLLFGVVVFFINSWKERSRRQQEYLERMMEKFLGNKVRKLLHMFDSDEGIGEYLRNLGDLSKRGGDDGYAIDELLFRIEHLLYLKITATISEKEFAFFVSDIVKILSSPGIQKYLVDYGGTGVKSPESFKLIKGFIGEKKLWSRVAEDVSGCKDEVDDAESVAGVVAPKDFREPVIFIRINQYYKEGMNDEQVYEVVRGEWRINPESTKGYRWVVAVAHGVIRGVFPVLEWKMSERTDCVGRWRFTKDSNTVVMPEMMAWIGKSVKWMFPKGSANPVRYFRPNVNTGDESGKGRESK